MAVTHTFRQIGKELVTKSLTPIKAIRAHCIQCIQSVYHVDDCKGYTCPLYPFRMGYDPGRSDDRKGKWDAMTQEQKDAHVDRMKTSFGLPHSPSKPGEI